MKEMGCGVSQEQRPGNAGGDRPRTNWKDTEDIIKKNFKENVSEEDWQDRMREVNASLKRRVDAIAWEWTLLRGTVETNLEQLLKGMLRNRKNLRI